MDDTWEQIVPFAMYVAMFLAIAFIDYLYMQVGIDSKKIIRADLFALAPTRPSNSILGIIFGGLGLFTFMNCFNEFSGTFEPIWCACSFLLIVAWFMAFLLEIFSLSSICLLATIMSSFQIILDVPKTHDFMHLGSGYILGLFFGLLISATLANIFIFIQQRGIEGGAESTALNVAYIVLLFVSHIAITLLLDVETLEMCWTVSFVLLWTVHWALWRVDEMDTSGETLQYGIGVALASAVVLNTILRVFFMHDYFGNLADLDITI